MLALDHVLQIMTSNGGLRALLAKNDASSSFSCLPLSQKLVLVIVSDHGSDIVAAKWFLSLGEGKGPVSV